MNVISITAAVTPAALQVLLWTQLRTKFLRIIHDLFAWHYSFSHAELFATKRSGTLAVF